MLLIYPPVAKPCEPPAGIARLYGAITKHGYKCSLLDANLEGLLYLLGSAGEQPDTWSKRATRNLETNLALLRSADACKNKDRYTRAIKDLSRLLAMKSSSFGVLAGLSDYHDSRLSPVSSHDLFQAAARPEGNPFFAYFSNRLSGLIEKTNPAFVGFSINFLSQALTAFAIIGFIKKSAPNLKIIIGGGLITSWMRRPGKRHSFTGLIDFMVEGPGEQALLSLLGIDTQESGQELPDYSMFSLDHYLAPGRIIPYSASTGCYWSKCTFCPEGAEKSEYRHITATRAVGELRVLNKNYRPALIHLVDNAVTPSLMAKLIEEPLGAPWYGFARVTPELTDPDFCSSLRTAGCVMLKLGIESGDDKVLRAINKGVTASDSASALDALHKAGIATYVYLLFGTPQESLSAAQKTMAFTIEHHDKIDFLNLAIFNMPIYGADAATLSTANFYEADLCLYTDFVHPLGWSRRLVRQFLDKTFKRHPAIAAITRRDPAIFSSNHAAFFTGLPGAFKKMQATLCQNVE